MTRQVRYSREVLVRTAAESRSLVEMMHKLGAPLGSGPRRYLADRLRHHAIDTGHFTEEPLPRRPRANYSKELLQEAVAHSSRVRDVLTYMGVPPYESAYEHVRRKLRQFGIETPHFTGRAGNGTAEIIPRAELQRAVSASRGVAGVLRALGRPVGGAGRAVVRRSIAAHGISTSHFVGRGHMRGQPSPARKSAETVLRKRPPGTPRTKTPLLRRALEETGVPRVCTACGVGDVWQGRRLVLEIDHVNGDRADNRRENLRYLCPSCHSQTRTFSRRPRGRTTDAHGSGGTQ